MSFFKRLLNTNDWKQPLCSQRLLFFKLQLKKTISDCRKYRFLFGYFLSSLSHMYSCQRTGYVHRTEVVERVQLLLETFQTLPPTKQNAHGKTKQHKQMPQPTVASTHFLYTTTLFSMWDNLMSILWCGSSLIPFLRKLRNKQLHEIKNNILQPFINKLQSCFDIVKPNHSPYSNFTPPRIRWVNMKNKNHTWNKNIKI